MYYRDPSSNLVWVNVPKNASSTMSSLVQRQGWIRLTASDPIDDLQFFGLIQNPWVRFVKGMAEMAWANNERSFDQVRKSPFFKMIFINPHLLPISIQYPVVSTRAKWIPMDSNQSTNDLLNQFFETSGSLTRIKTTDIKNRSSVRKIEYQKQVEHWLMNRYPYRQVITDLLEKDFELWRESTKPPKIIPDKLSWHQRFLKRIFTSE